MPSLELGSLRSKIARVLDRGVRLRLPTLRVYTHLMRRSPEEQEQLKALVTGAEWHHWAPRASSGTRWRFKPAESEGGLSA